MHGNGKEGRSILSIQFRENETTKTSAAAGWTIQGTRRRVAEAGSLYAIEEGFLAASSGKAYWVERNSTEDILVTGKWWGREFHGEWLSSNGKRGTYHRDDHDVGDEC